MATLAQLRSRISSQIGLDNTSGDIEQELIDSWINDGIVELLVRTHVNVECADLDTDADVWKYILPQGMLSIRNIWREGARRAMKRVDENTILDLRGGWESSDDTDLTRYAVVGSNLLLIWPTPTEAYSLDIFYVPKPTRLTLPDEDPSQENFGRIPSEFHKGIEYYARWQAADYDDDKSSQFGAKYEQDFEKYIQTYMLPAIKKKGGMTAPRAKLEYPYRRRGRRYPDVY